MVAISVKTNIKDVRKTLNRIQRKQIPFAASQALNDVAFSIRNDTVKVLWPRSVQVKQSNFARAAFRVGKANKRHLTASVFDSLDRQVFKRQIDGGIRLPYSSTHVAVPTWWAKTATGRIRKEARLGSPKLFKMTRRGNKPGLWIRTRKGLRLMYTLELKTHVPKSFPFFEFGVRRTRRMFPKAFDKRMKRALATAR